MMDIRSAAEYSFSMYSTFTALQGVVVILSSNLPNNDPGATQATADESKCFIRISEDQTNADGLGYKRTFAHEMFHCINKKSRPDYYRSDQALWWMEGAAEFFDEGVYPSPDPQALIERYRPRRTLWQQICSVDLFFEFLRIDQNWAYTTTYQLVLT
jgi:hypothetical protein